MTTMYDSDNPDSIPSGVLAAGYISGYAAPAWLARGFARFPNARRINVTPLIDGGDTFDVENGDLLPWEAPDAVQKARARGVTDPWVYLSYSLWAATRNEFHLRGIPEPLWWIALYDGIPELLPGAIAKQYADPARIPGHPHYDLSVVADNAFGGGGGIATQQLRSVITMATSDSYIVFGVGDNDQLFYYRFDNPTGAWVEGALNGTVLDFTVTGAGDRIDVYGRGSDRSPYHWYSADGGKTFSAFGRIGTGTFKSALQALGPGAPATTTVHVGQLTGTISGTVTG